MSLFYDFQCFTFSSGIISANVSRLENCGDEPTPSQHKYRKNFKLNNCAISDFPDTRHIFKPLLNAVLYFHELKKSTQRLSTTFGFRFSNVTQTWFVTQSLVRFSIFRKVFRLRIVFKLLKFENCLWRFYTKFGFSFPLSRKIFRLQFSLIFLRKNRSEAFCVSSENILHLTFGCFASVAYDSRLTTTNIDKILIRRGFSEGKTKPKPLCKTAVSRSGLYYLFFLLYPLFQIFCLLLFYVRYHYRKKLKSIQKTYCK